MISLFKNWKGAVEINGTRYENIGDATRAYGTISGPVSIKLLSSEKNSYPDAGRSGDDIKDDIEYTITVKKYMTQRASPDFNFMQKFNDDRPMPYRTMIGSIEKETRGMVYMNLHTDVDKEKWSGWIIKSAIIKKEVTNVICE